MLAQRFENDGRSILSLNSLQRRTKAQINRKIQCGVYRFEKVPCALCASSEFEPLAEKDRYGLWMPVVICKNCGLVQTNPRMNEASYREFYNLEYRKLYDGVGGPSEADYRFQYNRGRRIFTRLVKLGALPQDLHGVHVFEVGCSTGGVLGYFRDRGCVVRGVDVDSEYAEFGRRRHGLPIEIGTAAEVSFKRKPDLIIYSHVLEHLLDPAQELALIRQMLATDGALYLEVPGIKHLRDDYQMDFLRLLQNAHTYHFSLTSLAALARGGGFELLKGNEFVQAVFRKSRDGAKPVPIHSDYEAALNYLRRYRTTAGTVAAFRLPNAEIRAVFLETFAKGARIARLRPMGLLQIMGQHSRTPPKRAPSALLDRGGFANTCFSSMPL